jgi:hypothetical protein
MVKEIIKAAGVNIRKSRHTKPPQGTYGVYTDDVEAGGADGVNCIRRHDITLELYEAAPDDEREEAVEAELDKRGIPWTKQDRYWLQDEQRYQVIYEFTYYEKRRISNG